MKQCSKCGLEKEESEFYKSNVRVCKACLSEYQKSDKAKVYQKKYKQSSKYVAYRKKYQQSDEYRMYCRSYDDKEYQKKYRQNSDNKECMKKYQRKYRQNNDNKEYMKKYHNNNYRNNIQRRVAIILRSRLYKALKRNCRVGSAVRDLGCSISFLKRYLEERFKPGMTWENYGEWHIDHIYPLSKVDLTDREQLLRVCHYTNLQPLWAGENISKGNRILDF